MQQELVRMVAEKTGLPEEKARTAAETVIGYLKQNLPATVSNQLDNISSGGRAGVGELGKAAEGIGSKFNQ
jgi:hypothetical protein